jgi:hypothetical protein
MIEFMRGMRMLVVTISMLSVSKMASNARVYLLSVCHEHGEELDVGRAS